MAENEPHRPPPPSSNSTSTITSSVTAPPPPPPSRPTLTLPLPPRTFNETLFSPGFSFGISPGPMTLVSSLFPDAEDRKSFSQLLSGAILSPPTFTSNRAPFPPPTDEKSSRDDVTNPANSLSIVPPPPPPVFTVPPGFSPANLLDSPGFGLFSPQGPFGMTHQQALAQVTAQAAQAHPQLHAQEEYSFSLSSEPATSSTQFSSFATDPAAQHQVVPSLSDSGGVTKESTDFSHVDQRYQVSSLSVDKPADDGYNWRKYGQKQVKGSEFPRSYYKCTHPGCPVKKKVERSLDGHVTEIIYKGQHNHQPPQPNKRGKEAGSSNGNSNNHGSLGLASQFQSGNMNRLKDRKDQESSQATTEQISGTSDSDEVGDTETGLDESAINEPEPKRRNVEVTVTEATASHRTVTEPRIVVQTTSEVDLLDDGYRWRKYGQKVVKGNPYPRSYYKCTTPGCKVRKHVERAASDPRAVITTYEGKHNHDVPTAKGSSHNTANNNASQLRPKNVEKHTGVNKRDFGSNDQQPIPLRLKEEQIT